MEQQDPRMVGKRMTAADQKRISQAKPIHLKPGDTVVYG